MDAPDWFHANLAVTPREGVVTVDGCAVHWLAWGDPAAPPVVLVHGGGAHARWWAPLAPFLARDRTVVAVDLSGMGDSGWRAAYRTEVWADEVLAVATAAGVAGRPVLVGHSLGGTVAAVAGVRHRDRVAGVVLCDVGVRRHGERSRSGRHFVNRITYPTRAEALTRFKLIPRQRCDNDWFVAHIAEGAIRPLGPGGVEDPARPADADARGWAWKFDWRLFARTSDRPIAEYLADLAVPTAILAGEDSRVVTDEVAERVRTALGRPVPEVWVPDARHHLLLDQPVAFVTGLRALLGQLDDARRA
jgi:pimeloyl-ACP methyl ester carboxylesterase